MITEKMVYGGLKRLLITFEKDPNASVGTVARIGDKLFYFDADETEKQNPEEYLANTEKNWCVFEITKALNELEHEIPELYRYFQQKLRE